MNIFSNISLLLFTGFLISCGSYRSEVGGDTDVMVFPDEGWEMATPESQGVDPVQLKEAVDYLQSHSGHDGVEELVIIRNGYMIWKGDSIDKMHGIWSLTKSFTSTVLGLLIDEGRATLNTPAKNYVTSLTSSYPEVTLHHFTTMTSGYYAMGDEPRRDYSHGPSRTPFLPADTPLFVPPGSKFAYWDAAMNQLANILTQIAAEPIEKLFKRRIADEIGMDHTHWEWGDFGKVEGMVVNGGAGNNNNHIFISARELARFGYLFLNRGKWNGKQLISADWVDAATSVQVPMSMPLGDAEKSDIDGRGVYGYNWWVNGMKVDGQRKWPSAPIGTYAASGYNNNDMFIIPEWKMVIVRLGLDQKEFTISDNIYDTFLGKVGQAHDGDTTSDGAVSGDLRKWHAVTIDFKGPQASESDSDPNPFLDYRLQVAFTGPSGQKYNVPGFFDGDGNGNGSGHSWRVRFTPDEAGEWKYKASFRKGTEVAISLDPKAGSGAAFDGKTGNFTVGNGNPDAPGFHKWGRLEHVGKHYLKFKDGPYWIKGGTDSPEDFLAYVGFDNTPAKHKYKAHESDWGMGDPDWGGGKGRGIIGALNYLASKKVNSIYFLTMNVGGDGHNVWPWIGTPAPKDTVYRENDDDNVHYDISKLQQWGWVLGHAQEKGIFLHFVLSEAEEHNKKELDEGELGTERKLYYREIIARFGHHLALEWNLCEEYNLFYDLGPERIRNFARYIQAVDPYDHPITAHPAHDPIEQLSFMFGDSLFSMTSIQLGQRRIDSLVEGFREATAAAGRPLPISMDEFTLDVGQKIPWKPANDATRHRKEKLWPVYLSGGMVEFILEDLLDTDSFKKDELEKMWDYTWYIRKFMMEHLPFWEMEPADSLMSGEATITVRQGRKKPTFQLGAQVFVKPEEVYAIYLPEATSTGQLDLSGAKGSFKMTWYDPRSGKFVGEDAAVQAGSPVGLGTPPGEPNQDWVVLIKKSRSNAATKDSSK